MSEDILIMRPLSPLGLDAAEKLGTVHNYYGANDKEALLARVADKIGYVATDAGVGFTMAMADRIPNLKFVSNYGVGYDGIPIAELLERGIPVTNTPGVLNDAVAELAVGMMLALARRIPAIDAGVRAGEWTKSEIMLTGQVAGSRAGIIGLGRIGAEIAARLLPMKVDVSYHGRSEKPDAPYTYYADLTEMAKNVDWLICITPGGAGTKHIVNKEVLEALGPYGAVVNVARGSVIDEQALVAALKSGAVGGAALDVFEAEPNPLPDLLTMDNVVLQAHQGSATVATRTAMAQLVLDNIADFMVGRPLKTQVLP